MSFSLMPGLRVPLGSFSEQEELAIAPGIEVTSVHFMNPGQYMSISVGYYRFAADAQPDRSSVSMINLLAGLGLQYPIADIRLYAGLEGGVGSIFGDGDDAGGNTFGESPWIVGARAGARIRVIPVLDIELAVRYDVFLLGEDEPSFSNFGFNVGVALPIYTGSDQP
jgi:hypothetical protein